ncbi:hypothetical protein [Methylobacterium trifolii]|uniref:3',5'-cyclic-nucleotide phosphodiesterase n=1 Tax=Methylobacterium trifolii TaxID=1003092 RepID=A0ABQ4U5R3_9HYPH|nr:hypothetical protein [Methylobacterium trifolii]GJE62187.1 hypothetical protein MPOCJGCO_4317 [Methylobacterium trifolii]
MSTVKIASVALALCMTPALSFAQQSVGQENLKRYCTGDYLEHCSEFAPGGPEVQACFREKAKLLSPNCSTAIVAYQQEQGGSAGIRKVSAAR